MNNYIDYYNLMNNLNQQTGNSSSYNNGNLGYDLDPYVGFTRGNMFNGLYDSYMNYKPYEINPQNEKQYLLLIVQMYGFAAHDLGLYLDVYPNDSNAIKLRDKYVNLYKKSVNDYENKYGPLTLSSELLNSSPWNWDSKKWPWEENS